MLDVVVLINLLFDYLDCYVGYGGYFVVKWCLFVEGGLDCCIIGVDENEGWYLVN